MFKNLSNFHVRNDQNTLTLLCLPLTTTINNIFGNHYQQQWPTTIVAIDAYNDHF